MEKRSDFGVLYGQKTTEDALLIYSSYEDAKASPKIGDFIVLTLRTEGGIKYLARVEAEVYDEDPLFRSQDKTLVAVHYARIAERESPAWMAQIAWSDAFPLVLAVVAVALAVVFGRKARNDPAREREWHRLSLALAPYVTPFGFIWTTYLICSLPLFAISIPKALRLAPVPRFAALAGMVACWIAMQLVQVHDLWPIVAHMVGVIGLIVIALTLMSLETRQAEGRSTPLARATSIASG